MRSRGRLWLISGASLLQRIFSGFPDGLRGLALLCLRLAASALMANELIFSTNSLPLVLFSAVCVVTLAISSGLWTPAFSAGAAALRFFLPVPNAYGDWAHRTLDITVFLTLAMLGPGAYSIDGWLFGRRRIVVRHPSRSTN